METSANGQPNAPRGGHGALRAAAGTVATWLVVVAAAAVSLRVADAVPRLALGVPRGVRVASTVAELERLTGRRMSVPAYFPDTIEWPPASMLADNAGSAAIWCRERPSGPVTLVVATAPVAGGRVGAGVLPDSSELQREDASIGDRSAVLSRVRDADGAIWQQAEWRGSRQIVLIRYRGTLEGLLKIAGSVHE
jgi:hypothetical protein